MASMFLAVSITVSPFERLLVAAEKSTTSAPSRRAASPKLVRVRVEFSKNKLTQVLPTSMGNLRCPWSNAFLNLSAVSRISKISSAERSSSPNMCRCCQHAGTGSNSANSNAIGLLHSPVPMFPHRARIAPYPLWLILKGAGDYYKRSAKL